MYSRRIRVVIFGALFAKRLIKFLSRRIRFIFGTPINNFHVHTLHEIIKVFLESLLTRILLNAQL